MFGPLPNWVSTFDSSTWAGMTSQPPTAGRIKLGQGFGVLVEAENRIVGIAHAAAADIGKMGLRIKIDGQAGCSPRRARAAVRLSEVVVLPTPPF